jgi:hypothetical protein
VRLSAQLGQRLEEQRAGDHVHGRRSVMHLRARKARPMRRAHRPLRRQRMHRLSEPALSHRPELARRNRERWAAKARA